MKKIFLMLLASTFLFSCETNEINKVEEENSISQLFAGLPKVYSENQINLVASSAHGKLAQIDLAHRNINNEEQKSITISSEKYTNFGYNISFFSSTSESDKLSEMFGRENTINFSEKVLSRENEEDLEIYVPKIIAVKNTENLLSVSNTENLTIEWNRDENNNQLIGIVLISRAKDAEGNPVKDVSIVKSVEDVGNLEISYRELSAFPKGSNVDLYIGRGNQELFNETLVTVGSIDLVSMKIK